VHLVSVVVQVKQAFVGKDHKGDVPLHLKIASGLTTGAIAITVASPTDLVKVRWVMEAAGRRCRHARSWHNSEYAPAF